LLISLFLLNFIQHSADCEIALPENALEEIAGHSDDHDVHEDE
jgi:hypothetical protein